MIIQGGVVAALVIAGVWNLQPRGGPAASLPGDVPKGDKAVALKASGGPTRYRHCTGSGKLIVLIPGISYPMEIYNDLFACLAAAGKSVLLYDITGRGYSHSSGEPMSTDLFVRQLEELLTALGLLKDGTQLDIVAWSMGTVIATNFANRHPKCCDKLVLLAPIGALPAQKPPTAALLHVPCGVGNALAALVMTSTLIKGYRGELGDGHDITAFVCEHAVENPSMVRTITSTLRHCTEIDNNRLALKTTGESASKILVMWGDHDGSVNQQNINGIMALLGPAATLTVFPGESHAFFVKDPAKPNAQIQEFLA